MAKNKYILLYYWHEKNRFNHELFVSVKKTYLKFSNRIERIIAINSFDNSPTHFQELNEIPIEWVEDELGSHIHHQIKKLPCLMVLTQSNTLILRKDGLKSDCFKDIQECIKLFEIRNIYNIKKHSTL
jgi:hypothetical protein